MKFFKKWYTYQKERFPVLIYGIYIFSIVFAVFYFCNYVIKTNYASSSMVTYNINYFKIIPMFIVAFLQFLMVRIIDEFKDYEEDCKYRAYRPVPRGLITLKELKILFIICVILQILITYLVEPIAILYLLFMWLFFAIMSKSFFIKKIIDNHILLEVALDELLLPILMIYLSKFVSYVNISNSYYSFLTIGEIFRILLIGYIVSWIIEIARKVRCKEDEENGVKTYTAVFGIKKAMLILIILETILMLLHTSILGNQYILYTIGIYAIAILTNILFAIEKKKKYAKITTLVANMYVLICYFSMVLLIV